MQETWVQSLGWEDSLEKDMATRASILSWRSPWTEEPGGLQSTGWQESDTTEQLNHHHHLMENFKKAVCCSVAQSCPAPCGPTDFSTTSFTVLRCLPEFAQIHVHQVVDAIKPSHSLLSPSPPAFNLSQHQGLFK